MIGIIKFISIASAGTLAALCFGQTTSYTDVNGGYITLTPSDGGMEIASGNDAFSFIDFKGNGNLGSDFRGRFGFTDNASFELVNDKMSDVVLRLISGRTNTYLNLVAGVSSDAVGELSFERTGPAAGSFYIGGNATGNITFRSGGYTNRMIITADGKVGVGTSTPAGKFHVAGSGLAILNPDDGSLELGSGNDAFCFIDFRGSSNLSADYRGRLGFMDNAGFSMVNDGVSDVVLNLASGRTNTYLTLSAGAASDATGELSFERTGSNAGNLYIGGNASGNVVIRSGGYNSRLMVNAIGNVGVGTSSPTTRLDVAGAVQSISNSGGATNVVTSGSGQKYGMATDGGTGLWFGRTGGPGQAVNNDLFVATGGHVGLGTTAPTHKLTVNGSIRAREVVVETNIAAADIRVQPATWSDHVFEPGYSLAPLAEVEKHILEKRHLPGIPSAGEVAQSGVSVADMQAKLLAKVEELTLHLIAQQKQLNSLSEENKRQAELITHLVQELR